MTHQPSKTNPHQSSNNVPLPSSNHIIAYNPQQYWTEQGKTYKEQFRYNKKFELQEQMLIDKKYDLVIASEVLLHILPSEINEVVTKLVNMSNKNVVNIDWYEEQTPKKVAPHNFIHNYEEIYDNIPSITHVNRIPIEKRKGLLFKLDTKQSIFHAVLNN